MTIRKPYAAGYFYPADREQIEAFMQAAMDQSVEKKDAIAVMMPHAGYQYSGKTAARTIQRVRVTDTVILLGPNHTGYGAPFSLMAKGAWESPLGTVSIDETMAARILDASEYVADDSEAHREEHSLEVQVPFLRYCNPAVKIVPVTIGSHDLDAVREVAGAIAGVLAEEDALIVISSDMTHYENAKTAERKDRRAIEAMIRLDEYALDAVVAEERLSMCGFIPAYCALIAAKTLGAERGDLVEYCTSGDTTGDYERVVGYAGLIIR